jgi:hypothetical protein
MKLPLALSPWHSRQIIDHDGYFVAECRNTVDRKPIVEAVNDHADLRGDLRSLSAAINRLEDASEERGRREAELFNTVEDLAQRKHELEERVEVATTLLNHCEVFISGFEDDPLQHGLMPLLEQLRAFLFHNVKA